MFLWQCVFVRATPIPIRKRILELYDLGKSTREIAQFSGFCVAAVRRVHRRYQERRTLEPQTHRCGRKTLLSEERKQRLQQLLSEQPDVAARRAHWHEDLAVERTDCLVFVGESGANTKMTRLRGRALGGERLRAHIPHGRYQTSTLIAGIRLEGPFAPWLFEGPMDGEMFLAWERQGSAPALRPGDVVIPDNPATHKIRGVRETIEAAGARLRYLPPYSPDFNPIEPMWSKAKQILRSHAPRTD